jgi:hypothetical protein
VEKHGVGYFKWDGIQFSCSEPDHGHPVGVYSRRAVMDSVIELCRANRALREDLYLNITSGTWLSPWWLQYADQIWMQGYDYGYADVPSISRRDRAITYRDYVLYDDLVAHNFWFPIENLMTHGIIKGHLQKLGGEAEPLDKFTDNALLYFARGVSMWELYISPNLLSEGEWNALVQSINWAKDRFDTLQRTEMVGGSPGAGEPYGYAHFKGDRCIVALRNPSMQTQELVISLLPELGMSVDAKNLVVEQTYPRRRILEGLFSTGEKLPVELQGYEMAVYEIYPLEKAGYPLITGVDFFRTESDQASWTIGTAKNGGEVRILNPGIISSIKIDDSEIAMEQLAELIPEEQQARAEVELSSSSENGFEISVRIGEHFMQPQVAILLVPEGDYSGDDDPTVAIALDGKQVDAKGESQEGSWAWYIAELVPGEDVVTVSVNAHENSTEWRGRAEVWLIYRQKKNMQEIVFTLAQPAVDRPMPPSPWPGGTERIQLCIGGTALGSVVNQTQ